MGAFVADALIDAGFVARDQCSDARWLSQKNSGLGCLLAHSRCQRALKVGRYITWRFRLVF